MMLDIVYFISYCNLNCDYYQIFWNSGETFVFFDHSQHK
jgi:hypothetical protein